MPAPLTVTKRLSDLSVKELARLLNLSNAEAEWLLKWNKRASAAPVFASLPMNTSVEEIQRLRDRGELHKLHPDIPQVPEDVVLRWRQLQELLRREDEFETRYPAVYDLLRSRLDRVTGRRGMPLPSFGIRVARHDPRLYVGPATDHAGSDAYSSSGKPHRLGEAAPSGVDWKFSAPEPAYLRGVLLAILSREEYQERIAGMLDPKLLADLQIPSIASVRITDLRLAADFDFDLGTLGHGSNPLLSGLQMPITMNHVLQWKQKTLEEHTELLEQAFGDPRSGILAVSFAAAALCLFIDFGMPDIENAKPYRLAEQIEALAKVTRGLINRLNGAAKKLETLFANRPANKPPRPDNEYYQALRSYRMGCSLEDISDQLDITRWNSAAPSEGGSKSWKRYVEKKIARGKGVEDERFPRAAEIFDGEDDPSVRRTALKAYEAYQDYLVEREEEGEAFFHHFALWVVGRRIGVNPLDQPGQEIIDAYIQLGCCIEQDRPLLP